MTKIIKKFPSLFTTGSIGDMWDNFDCMVENFASAGFLDSSLSKKLSDFEYNDGWLLSFKNFPRGGEFVNSDGNLVIEMALAGYSKDQISITTNNHYLCISSEKCDKTEDCCKSLSRKAFKKEFSDVGHQWDLESAEATFENGLLRVEIRPRCKKKENITSIEIK